MSLMPTNDSLLFIDTNKYLDFYRTDIMKKCLPQLLENIDHIFITQQIAREVQRNKLRASADFFIQQKPKLENIGQLRVHLSDHQDLLQKWTDFKDLTTQLDNVLLDLIAKISCSEDKISKQLSTIFEKAVPHSAHELRQARDRKELGNPPGKPNNPIGDELNWEQILTHLKDKNKKRLWIISKDSDYGTFYGGKGFLNCFLYDELCRIVPKPEVYLFDNMSRGIDDFFKTIGVPAEQRFTQQEVEEIEKEERSLSQPMLYQSHDFANLSELASQAVQGMYQSIDTSLTYRALEGFFQSIKSNPGLVSKVVAQATQIPVPKFHSSEKDQEKSEQSQTPPQSFQESDSDRL